MVVKYLLVWFLLAIVAIANGVIRQGTYGKVVPELIAHQISTVTAIIASGAVVWLANRIWVIESAAQAWAIGLLWLIFTVIFEFGFGHYIAGNSWDRLLADYDIANGRAWIFFLVWLAIVPYVIFKLAEKGA